MKGRRFGRLVEDQIDLNAPDTSTSDAVQRALHKNCCAGHFAGRCLPYLFIGAWAICSMACAPRRRSFEIDSPQRMKLQLEQAVPRGMLLADAYETMRRRGCCERGVLRAGKGGSLEAVAQDGLLEARAR